MSLDWMEANTGMLTWDHAKWQAKEYGNGWRLPTVTELASLYRYETRSVLTYPDMKGWFWSAQEADEGFVYCVNLTTGDVRRINPNCRHRARMVRKLASSWITTSSPKE